MKKLLTIGLLVGSFVSFALPVQAAWQLDKTTNPKTLTDGNWRLKLVAYSGTKEFTIGTSDNKSAYVEGSGELDLTTVESDTAGAVVIRSFKNYSMSKCTQLTSLKLPETIVAIAGYVFEGCSELVSVTPFFPGGLSQLGSGVFQNCTKLEGDLILTNSAITVVGQYAFNNTKIRSVALNPNVVEIQNWAFGGCSQLTRLSPMSFPALTYVGNCNFSSANPGLEGDTLELTSRQLQSLRGGAFDYSAITNLVLSPTLTTLAAFNRCPNLESVRWIPSKKGVPTASSVTFAISFSYCPKLKHLDIPFRSPFVVPEWCFYGTPLAELNFWGRAPTEIKRYFTGSGDYKLAITCARQQDEAGWLALKKDLTAEDLNRPTYPGPKCFGLTPDSTKCPSWLVWGSSPYDPQGLSVSIH